jgi:hypothetical protein
VNIKYYIEQRLPELLQGQWLLSVPLNYELGTLHFAFRKILTVNIDIYPYGINRMVSAIRVESVLCEVRVWIFT